MIVAETIYTNFIEVKSDTTKTDTEKLDLILGDIEIILLDLLKDFSVKHDMAKTITGINIESMKKRYGLS